MRLKKDIYLDYEKISHHKSMLSDGVRTKLFMKAIEEIVNQDAAVVDLGAGTGILSFFASRSGAKSVTAIERTGIIEVAKDIASKNSLGNKVKFVQSDSKDVKLEEKCDVLISECLGYMAIQENMINDFLQFRKKWLKSFGTVLPERAKVFLVPVEEEIAYRENVGFWERTGNKYELDFSSIHNIAGNSTYRHHFDPSSFISDPEMVKDIDFMHDEHVDLETNAEFKIQRDSVCHGMCGYFSSQLSPTVLLDTSPYSRKTHWQNEFFPLFKPLALKKGDILEFSLKSELGTAMVDWIWEFKVNGKIVESHSSLNGIRVKEQQKNKVFSVR